MRTTRPKTSAVSFPVLCMLAALSLPVRAATLRVPSEYGTIQAAIAAALEGDTILIADGIYGGPGNRDLAFGGKNLIVRSENGATMTVIDCGGTVNEHHRGFHLHNGETNASVIQGLTVRGGYVSLLGGAGIFCDGASPTLLGCILQENLVEGFGEDGGGVLLRNSHAQIEECTFLGNFAPYGGGLACRSGSQVRIERCTFAGNSASYGGGVDTGATSEVVLFECTIHGNQTVGGFEDPGYGGGVLSGGDVTVEGCTITGNLSGGGAGVAVMAGEAHIVECTLAANRSASEGEGGGGLIAYGSSAILERTVLWNNCAAFGSSGIAAGGSVISFECCVLEEELVANGGQIVDLGRNLEEAPLFCFPASCDLAPTTEGDYRVGSASPCLPAKNPCGEWIGSEPVGCPVAGAPSERFIDGPGIVALGTIQPNPVRGHLRANLNLTGPARCVAKIIDVEGRRVETVVDEVFSSGSHVLRWTPPRRMSSGVYYLVVRGGQTTQMRSFLLLRD